MQGGCRFGFINSSGTSVFPSFHSTVLSWSFGFASCGPTIVAMVVKITSTQSLRHAGRTASLGMLQSGFLLCPFDQSCLGIVGTELAAGKEVIELLEPTFSPWTWEGAHFPCDPLILGQKQCSFGKEESGEREEMIVVQVTNSVFTPSSSF